MVQVDAERAREYREAWEAWQRQLGRLHAVFLDGEAIGPPQLKGLLNREARAKERYDAARAALLGVGPAEDRLGGGIGGRQLGRRVGDGGGQGGDEGRELGGQGGSGEGEGGGIGRLPAPDIDLE